MNYNIYSNANKILCSMADFIIILLLFESILVLSLFAFNPTWQFMILVRNQVYIIKNFLILFRDPPHAASALQVSYCRSLNFIVKQPKTVKL